MVRTMPTPVQNLAGPTWTSTAKPAIASMITTTAQVCVGSTAEHGRDRPDAAGDADASGEELEHQQGQAVSSSR